MGIPVSIEAVFDPDRDRAQALVDETAHARVASSVEHAIEGVDAVYVCTWTSEHPPVVHAAADRDLAVFCEKPLAMDAATARSMTVAVQRAGITNQVGLVMRDYPAFVVLRKWLQDPSLGRVMSVCFLDDQYIPTQGFYGSTWRGDPSLAGGGALLEHSIHDVDMLEWLFGELTSVVATARHFHEIDNIEDAVTATYELATGATATLISLWHDVLERANNRRMEIFCERGHLLLEGWGTGPITKLVTGSDPMVLEGEALWAEARTIEPSVGRSDGRFATAALAGTPSTPDLATALRAHDIVDATYRSASSDSRVVIVR